MAHTYLKFVTALIASDVRRARLVCSPLSGGVSPCRGTFDSESVAFEVDEELYPDVVDASERGREG